MEPGQPIAVTRLASSQAIDAFLGTERSSPRVVSDETKLAITDRASRGFAISMTFGAFWHRGFLFLSWCSSIILFELTTLDEPLFSTHAI
jgi:hypothetical protein